MTYSLEFQTTAKKEWDSLDASIRKQFKKKLIERLETPKVISAKLSGMDCCYKIKLRSLGYRLVYHVCDSQVIVTVIAAGKRERHHVYKLAAKRI